MSNLYNILFAYCIFAITVLAGCLLCLNVSAGTETFGKPSYILSLLLVGGIFLLFIIMKNKTLLTGKQYPRKIIAGRICKLKEKNRELTAQKNKVLAQVKEQDTQNKHFKELEEFKWQLVNALVHDLKNPLNQILAASPSENISYLSRRMLVLISNMLDVEKYQQTEFVLSKEMLPLKNIIDEVIAQQKISLNEKNIEVKIQMDNVFVCADKELLIRIFDNLIANAVRFSPLNQSIEIEAHYSPGQTVEIRIKNYGNTIPFEDLERIFDKYTQVHKSSDNYRSTGLGLAFCRMALRAHGHTIKAANFYGGVMLSFSLDGQLVSSQKITNTIAVTNTIVLSDTEKESLKPWFSRLKAYEIYQSSDILNIVEDMPDNTKSIIAFKQQIIDAVFSSNSKRFNTLLKKYDTF